jgi:class 3 adenylate cyclase
MTIRRIALLALVTFAVAGCSTGPTAATNPTTCADWRSMSETAQTELVTTIVDANDLLEAVRAGQHEGPAVTRATLIQGAVGSVSKNCDLTGQPVQIVADLVVQLYGAGRVSDGYFGASGAPTPERAPSPATP